MTNQQHPITPPHDKVYWWWEEACKKPPSSFYEKLDYVAAKAAEWGADQELEACIKYFFEYDSSWGENSELITGLRTARRPKPKSLVEEALEALEVEDDAWPVKSREKGERFDLIRRALERLQELEGQNDG